jgi:PAS domain-containing protein
MERLTESQLLQSSPVSFWVHDEDKEPFEGNPSAVHSHELPADCIEGNGVDVIGEKEPDFSKYLLYANTASSHVIREELDEER